MNSSVQTSAATGIVTLSNGLRVANFSSSHEFNFVDGTVVPAVPKSICDELSLARDDKDAPWPGPLPQRRMSEASPRVRAVTPGFALTGPILMALAKLQHSPDVDIILIPFPMLQSIKDTGLIEEFTKCGTVMMADRVTKAAHIDQFGR